MNESLFYSIGRKEMKLHIQNIVDVITNSSSELFIINNPHNLTFREVISECLSKMIHHDYVLDEVVEQIMDKAVFFSEKGYLSNEEISIILSDDFDEYIEKNDLQYGRTVEECKTLIPKGLEDVFFIVHHKDDDEVFYKDNRIIKPYKDIKNKKRRYGLHYTLLNKDNEFHKSLRQLVDEARERTRNSETIRIELRDSDSKVYDGEINLLSNILDFWKHGYKIGEE